MPMDYRKRNDCRLCRSTSLENVLTLAPTPLANELLTAEQLGSEQEKFPLSLYFCDDCHHVQLLDIVNPERLFRNYLYVSGTSPVFKQHFKDYAGFVIDNFGVAEDSLIVDIGSNDGVLLGYFKARGMRVQGVDPARSIAKSATDNGIDTLGEFFTPAIATQIVSDRGHASIVVANNVFAHIDNLHEILEGASRLLDQEGLLVIEVSYLKSVLQDILFDTIYHEHLDYHSVGPLRKFFAANGFELIDVMAIPSHGGSLRAVAKKKGGRFPVQDSVAAFIDEEARAGLYRASTFRAFDEQINVLGGELVDLMKSIKGEGKKIVAFGLPAKATTLMHQFGIGPEYIDYVVDDSPLKQGLYSPGYKIPVVSSERLQVDKPDCIVILAWNFAAPIIAKLDWYIEGGGTVIVPLPELKIVGKT
jgi:SAM-dependent methyltransferase